ncbi:MAG: putative DUF214 family protein, partial [Streblomastix strix]
SLEKWASKITYALRFGELDVQMPVASAFEDYIGISILLMYSLVMIFVDTRTFEVGILRMVGLDRLGVIGILIAQALLYSIPGWILGIILGFVGKYIVMYILEDSSSIPLQKLISALIIIISTLIAFGISYIASILPIRQALSQNLHDSIDVTHTKASAIMVTIEKAEALQKPWGLLMSSIILTGIGVGNVFLQQHFYSGKPELSKTLAVKNLGANRKRNRKTTLLFSISLAFIVFVNVIVSIALSMIDTMIYMEKGCNLDVRGQPYGRGGGVSLCGSIILPLKKFQKTQQGII